MNAKMRRGTNRAETVNGRGEVALAALRNGNPRAVGFPRACGERWRGYVKLLRESGVSPTRMGDGGADKL